MKKMYVVMEEDYDEAHVYGVYDSKKRAEKEIARQTKDEFNFTNYYIVESELNYVREW